MINGFLILFLNISGGEILVILLIVFIVFGPGKIPEIARSIGRMVNEVKKASGDISREFRKETDILGKALKNTGEEITKHTNELTEDPLTATPRRKFTYEETLIPEVYPETEKTETEEPGAVQSTEEKSEKPIQ